MKFLMVIFVGSIVCLDIHCIAGRPPNYSQDQMPVTSFSCRDKILGGYYADPETQCQMFHVCVKVPGLGVQDYKFLCPNDTSFDQENQICDDWYNIDCEASTLYYSDNFDLYRIGTGDVPRTVNNAVSDVDDDNYLQRSDRGENVGSDLLRGSHSGNFFSNKHRGREDEDLKDELNKKKKTTNNKNQVRKLLTGKRPVAPPNQATVQNEAQEFSQQTRTNFAGRNRVTSNFQRNQPVTESIQRQTEVYNNQRQTELYNNQRQNFNYNNQRNFYTPTTPKIETTATQRSDYFKTNFYNPVTQQNLKANHYDNVQTYRPQTFSQSNNNVVAAQNNRFVPNFQTTRNSQTSTTSTEPPVIITSSQPPPPEKLNNYETQKLFKINTAAYTQQQQQQAQDQFEDSKDDEFLKTAHSQNLGASNLNRVQNSIKQWNANFSTNYNLFQTSSAKPNVFQQFYNPTTLRPSSHPFNIKNNQPEINVYTPSSTQKPYQQSHNNFFTTTQKSQSLNNVVPSSTPIKTFSPQQFNNFFTPSTTQKPYHQTQNNYYTPSATLKTTQQHNLVNTVSTTINKHTNNFYASTAAPQRNYYSQTQSSNIFQQNSVRPQNPTQKPYQEFHRKPENQFTQNINQPTTIKPRSRGGALYSHTTDATESPRPFTASTPKQLENKDKDQYDYAYYDDGAQAAEYEVETLDFARTKSRS